MNGFFIKQGFNCGKFDTILFIRHKEKYILLVQIYVDNIIFGFTNESLCREFASLIQEEFEMSLIGELTYFLGLQIKQGEEGTFISITKHCLYLLKMFEMKD